MQNLTRRLAVTAAVALILPLAARAMAEELETSPSSIKYLPTEDETRDEIARVDKLVAQQEWRKAIEICQKFITKPSRGVVRLGDDLYGSPRALCERKLRALPAPGKLLYRTLYDPEAERLYKRALAERDPAAAQALVSNFALTTYGAPAMNLLATLWLERGDLQAALACWHLWMEHADVGALPEAARRLTAAKIAVTAAALGNAAALDRAVALFGEKGAVVDIAGARISRADELRQLASGLLRKSADAPDAAPAELDFSRWETGLSSTYAARMSEYYGSAQTARYGCFGEVADGMLYLNTPEGPRAYDALTGRLVWQRQAKNYDSEAYESLRSFAFHCRVYPMPGQAVLKLLFVSGGSRLGAYEADTGRALWSKAASSFAKVQAIGQDPNLRAAFSCPVVCRGRTACVILETSRAEVFLLAFDAVDGSLRWATPIGGSAPRSGYRLSFPSAVVIEGPDVLFCNGGGIIGKCDAATGDIAWLVPYRRNFRFAQERYYDSSVTISYCPAVSTGELFVCRPSDGQQLIAVRIADGQVKWQKDAAGASLLGVSRPAADSKQSCVFVGGDQVGCLRADTGQVVWTWPVPEQGPHGLGRLTGRGVIVATRRAVYVLDPASGELGSQMRFPTPGGDAVSVLCDRDTAAVVSKDYVRALGNKAATKTLLDQAGARLPGDPWLMAAQAKLLGSDGQFDAALERLTEAIRTARKKPGGNRLAADLERDMIALYHQLFTVEWKAGRRMEAFGWMRRALHSVSRAPYECRLGYRDVFARDPAEPHTLVFASGDSVSGKLVGFEFGMLTFVVRGEPWSVATAGLWQVALAESARPAADAPHAGILLANDDRVTGRIESVRDGTVRVRAAFGEFDLRLADVAAFFFPGSAPPPSDETVYLKLRNGDELSGVVRAFDGTDFLLDAPSAGKRRVRVVDVLTVANRRLVPPQPSRLPDRTGEPPTEEGGEGGL